MKLLIKNNIISFVSKYKMVMLVSAIITVSIIGVGVLAVQLRNKLAASAAKFQKDSSDESNYSSTSSSSLSLFDSLNSTKSSVLGLSTDTSPTPVNTRNDYTYTYTAPTPFPVMTLVPVSAIVIPTSVPSTNNTSTSSSSCAGKPNADNSQVYVSSKTTAVNTPVTITVDLLDCNNNHASDDNLTITLSNSDSSARVNDSALPVTIKAQGGKASFTVNSQNTITDTFVITDTNNSFTVTTPGYHNPSVTFTNNSSGNANCTTASGVPNAWYSTVYVSSVTGTSARFTVDVRDCNKSTVSNDTLRISLSSGDSSAQADGNNLPFSINVQNGEIGFTVTSQNAATDTFIIQDTTSSFTVTDANDHNPTVTFSGPAAPAPTDTPTPQITNSPTASPVPTSAPTSSPTPAPVSPSP